MNKKSLLVLIPALMLAACGPVESSTSETKPSENPETSESTSDVPTSSETPTTSESSSSSSESSSSSSEDSQPSTPGYDVPTGPLTGYYASVDPTKTGAELLSQVREVTVSKHTRYTSYNDCRPGDAGGLMTEADAIPGNPTMLQDFYTHAALRDHWDGNKYYNREHVWPQSLSSGNWGKSGGGSDILHIRPNYCKVNSDRGNLPFGVAPSHTPYKFTNPDTGESLEAGYRNGGVWEPMDFAKGDVARIVLYTFIHYNNDGNLEANDTLPGRITSTAKSQTSSGSMPITKVISAGSAENAFKLLIEWNKLDPVDEIELNRNDVAERHQGNRNPFVDHPWLVDAIW